MSFFSCNNNTRRNSNCDCECNSNSNCNDVANNTNSQDCGCHSVRRWQFNNLETNSSDCKAIAIGEAIANALQRHNSCPSPTSYSIYGTFYSHTPRTVERSSCIIFDDVSSVSGLSLNDDKTRIKIESDGTYLITYQLQTITGLGAATSICVNDKTLSGTRVDLETNATRVSNTIITPLLAKDTLSLSVLDRDISLSCGTNATLTVIKL